MSRRKAHASVGQMADAIDKAVAYLGESTREQLEADEMRRDAIVHNLEVVGEAARRVPLSVQQEHPEIPWTGMIGLRNRLTHGYDTVNYEAVWRILTEEVRTTIRALRALQTELERKGL